jgi:hypothetical protein
VLGGLQFAGGSNGRDLWSQPALVFLPRFGLAYQLDSKTVIRAGYGIFYDTLGANRSPAIQTGFTASTPITAGYDNSQTVVATLANPVSNGLNNPNVMPTSSTFGAVTAQDGFAREFQAARIRF